ncbi:helix-turn-helix domain-containing protein [Saccharothrix sp. HUAS TT10]|uniref:helix-turn-helix domain-containing protein n=1 Tax=Saccharothrix sp. HUAS TT10 TaxID=3447450 RepID=UPI003F71E220
MPRRTLPAKQLGRRLRRLRVQTGKSQAPACTAVNAGRPKDLHITQGYLSRIENGSSRPDPDELATLCARLDAGDETTGQLTALLARTEQPAWWDDYGSTLGADLRFVLELEDSADTLRIYESMFVSGLLETEEYAHAVISATGGNIRPMHVPKLVDLRMERREHLFKRSGFRGLVVVMGETAVRQIVGGRSVMKGQLKRLEVDIEAGMDIRYLPYAKGPWPAVSSCAIYGFDDDVDPDVVEVDAEVGRGVYEDHDNISAANHMFARALRNAEDPAATAAFLHGVAADL